MSAPVRPASGGLTAHELLILRLAANGLSDREIGRRLGRSHNTIASHLKHAFAAIDAVSRAHAVALAMASGWITAGDIWQPEPRTAPESPERGPDGAESAHPLIGRDTAA